MIHSKGHLPKNTNQTVTHEDAYRVLFISTYPSRECGLATFSKDLIESIKDKFHLSCEIDVCAIDHSEAKQPIHFQLNTFYMPIKRNNIQPLQNN